MTGDRIRLGVNIDHVATLREARGAAFPDPLQAAFIAVDAGADGITLHLREDRRHIRDRDVERIREHVPGTMNLEMAATAEMIGIARTVKPADCCLVPERREELTTEGGLDVVTHAAHLKAVCRDLAEAGIRVSLFIDPEPAQIEATARVGAPAIEIHTGAYANATDRRAQAFELGKIAEGVARGRELGLVVNAGHGLHYQNVEPVAAIPGIHELNIGHAIVAHAVMVGLDAAVRRMKALIAAAVQAS